MEGGIPFSNPADAQIIRLKLGREFNLSNIKLTPYIFKQYVLV